MLTVTVRPNGLDLLGDLCHGDGGRAGQHVLGLVGHW